MRIFGIDPGIAQAKAVIDDNKIDRQKKPEKYFWFEHAERNAIYNAARIGVSTKGCTIYLKKPHQNTLKLIPIETLKKFAIDLS